MKLGTQTASVTNHLMSGTVGAPEPVVGMGATVLMWTDRRAATIVSVARFKSGARIGEVSAVEIQMDKATRTDSNGMSEQQEYEYERDPKGSIARFKKNKRGAFVSPMGQLRIGDRREYHDYSF